jgi:hypothetical protein
MKRPPLNNNQFDLQKFTWPQNVTHTAHTIAPYSKTLPSTYDNVSQTVSLIRNFGLEFVCISQFPQGRCTFAHIIRLHLITPVMGYRRRVEITEFCILKFSPSGRTIREFIYEEAWVQRSHRQYT